MLSVEWFFSKANMAPNHRFRVCVEGRGWSNQYGLAEAIADADRATKNGLPAWIEEDPVTKFPMFKYMVKTRNSIDRFLFLDTACKYLKHRWDEKVHATLVIDNKYLATQIKGLRVGVVNTKVVDILQRYKQAF
jgi:hypothetical protein